MNISWSFFYKNKREREGEVMKLTEMQISLIKKMKQQEADRDTVNSVMPQMIDYLISRRNKTVNKST